MAIRIPRKQRAPLPITACSTDEAAAPPVPARAEGAAATEDQPTSARAVETEEPSARGETDTPAAGDASTPDIAAPSDTDEALAPGDCGAPPIRHRLTSLQAHGAAALERLTLLATRPGRPCNAAPNIIDHEAHPDLARTYTDMQRQFIEMARLLPDMAAHPGFTGDSPTNAPEAVLALADPGGWGSSRSPAAPGWPR